MKDPFVFFEPLIRLHTNQLPSQSVTLNSDLEHVLSLVVSDSARGTIIEGLSTEALEQVSFNLGWRQELVDTPGDKCHRLSVMVDWASKGDAGSPIFHLDPG